MSQAKTLTERELRRVLDYCALTRHAARNRAMVRLTLSAALTDSELDHVDHVAREIAPLVKPWDWPIARRGRASVAQAS